MKRVVIVDDDAFFRALLKDIIVRAGFELVGEAEDGQEGVEKVLSLKPDVAIFDIVMPVKTGIDAAKEVTAAGSGTKIIVCTTMHGDRIINDAKAAGAVAYIRKPFVESDVVEVLRSL